MAKVFSLFRNVPQDKGDWFLSNPINASIVDSISVEETDGKRQPTSIPSPFAQMDLVRAAFRKVVSEFDQNNVDLDVSRDAHRLVSNALDIGQIFFNYDLYQSRLKVTRWTLNNDLSDLKEAEKTAVSHFGDTLDLFLNSGDRTENNFHRLKEINILSYNNQVIGGTSSKTLFFASANATKLGVDIHCGNDRMLDDKPLALYKRDPQFVKYFFYLSQQPAFENFPEISDYLDRTLSVINRENLDFANELRSTIDLHEFHTFHLPQRPGISLNILPDLPVLKTRPIEVDRSDFFINTTRTLQSRPLVLPTTPFNERLRYVDENWLPDTQVPKTDENALENRRLPRLGIQHPYLTEGDFLEDYIVKLPYKISGEHYFVSKGAEEYLLPIKQEIFNYFSAQDIIDKNMISLTPRAGNGVEVKLNIPIQKDHFITYSKIYTHSASVVSENPLICEVDFSLAIYPFFKTMKEPLNYTIAVSQTDPNNPPSLTNVIPVNSEENSTVNPRKRERSATDILTSSHYLLKEQFDALLLTINGRNNVVLPKMRKHHNTANVHSFAIDFGTTNTHVEYIHANINEPVSYKIKKKQLVFLRDEEIELKGRASINASNFETVIKQELISNDLGGESYPFPFRSVILENRTINYDNPHFLYGDVNIGFDYEKVSIKEHLTKRTNLKWMHMSDGHNQSRIKLFVRQLLELCRNQVLANNGNLSDTKITWLYPTSMSYNHRAQFEEAWRYEFQEIFPDTSLDNLKSVPESIAPFYYYQSMEGLMNQVNPTISVDIGGGTSDVTVFKKNEPLIITSFRFAGNAIFGDGYNNAVANNGFVKKYYDSYSRILGNSENNTVEEANILNTIRSQSGGDDLINYLFSLSENFNLRSQNLNIDFTGDLKMDEDLKLTFLIFYSAIVYHVAQLMKERGLETPGNIIFSGTASKSLTILDPSRNHKGLNDLFKNIIAHVFSVSNNHMRVYTNPSPKVLTAKGALMVDQAPSIQRLIKVSLGTNEVEENITYAKIDDQTINSVINNVKAFFSLLDDLNEEMDFKNAFGISNNALLLFGRMRKQHLEDYTRTGINERIDDIQDINAKVDETLFFYPLKGLLHAFASQVVEQ